MELEAQTRISVETIPDKQGMTEKEDSELATMTATPPSLLAMSTLDSHRFLNLPRPSCTQHASWLIAISLGVSLQLNQAGSRGVREGSSSD